MFGIKATALLLAGLFGCTRIAMAQEEPVFNVFFINGQARTLAGPLAVLSDAPFSGDFQQCYNYCAQYDDCLGFAAGTLT